MGLVFVASLQTASRRSAGQEYECAYDSRTQRVVGFVRLGEKLTIDQAAGG